MSILSREEELFLHLLSCAISDTPAEAAPFATLSNDQWLNIGNLARKQSVPALVADRILLLPKESLPKDRNFLLQQALLIQAVEQSNRTLTKVLHEVKQDYDRANLPFALLKGQTLAYYYPNPLLRSSGDLDLYLYRSGDYDRANRWVANEGYRLQGESLYEQLYWRGKVAVENHLYIAYFGRKKYDQVLAEMVAPIIENDAFASLELDGQIYRTLPTDLNAVYIFQHILHHFCYLGIGLRQVCDWIIFLSEHHKSIDVELFQLFAERLDLLRPMRLFALMAVRHLHVAADIFPFDIPHDAKSLGLSDLIIRDIFRGGNFGLDAFAGKQFSNIWRRRWFMFRKTLARSLKVGAISPHHIRVTPFIAIVTRLRLLLAR